MSNPPALLLRGQMPTSYLAREPSTIPTHVTKLTPVPNLNILAKNTKAVVLESVRVCVCVCVFLPVFLYRPVGPKGPNFFFRRRAPATQ